MRATMTTNEKVDVVIVKAVIQDHNTIEEVKMEGIYRTHLFQ